MTESHVESTRSALFTLIIFWYSLQLPTLDFVDIAASAIAIVQLAIPTGSTSVSELKMPTYDENVFRALVQGRQGIINEADTHNW